MARDNRAKFEQSVADFLGLRPNLVRIFVLIDSRLDPQVIDVEFVSWLCELQRPFALVFTKADKLKAGPLKRNADQFLAAIAEWCSEPPSVSFPPPRRGMDAQTSWAISASSSEMTD